MILKKKYLIDSPFLPFFYTFFLLMAFNLNLTEYMCETYYLFNKKPRDFTDKILSRCYEEGSGSLSLKSPRVVSPPPPPADHNTLRIIQQHDVVSTSNSGLKMKLKRSSSTVSSTKSADSSKTTSPLVSPRLPRRKKKKMVMKEEPVDADGVGDDSMLPFQGQLQLPPSPSSSPGIDAVLQCLYFNLFYLFISFFAEPV